MTERAIPAVLVMSLALAACGSTQALEGTYGVYVTNEVSGELSVIDPASNAVIATITLAGENVRPMGVVVSPDDTRPWGIAVSPDGTRLYTANGPSNDVTVVDALAMTVVTKIRAGASPWGVVIIPRR